MIKIIKVTNNCIERGERANSGSCPIALALEDMVSIDTKICVSDDFIYLSLDRGETWWGKKSSRGVCKFIRDFDYQNPVKPFEFNLNIPKKFLPEKP